MVPASKAERKAALDVASWMFNVVTSVGIIMVNKALMATYGFSFGRLCNDLEELWQSAKSIQAVLNDAEEKAEEDMNVRRLLDKLECTAYDAQDIIDELGFELISLSRLEADDQIQLSTKVCSSITSLSYRISDIKESFEDMSCHIEALDLKENHRSKTMANEDIESLVVHDILYGREDDISNLIDLLLEEKSEIPCVVPLAGTSRIGKTTLVQSIYDDLRICKHFDRRGWVLISKDYDLIMLNRAILESITQSSWSWAEPSSLQTRLEYELEKKRFLIVLDDFCSETLSLLESFRSVFSSGQMGTKILLLAREETVAMTFQPTQSYRLDRVSEESCWQLFLHYAFPFHDHAMDQNLMFVGKRITEKCKGMLLPIKMLGAILYSETDRFEWEDICETEKWDSDDSQNILRSAFKISYDCLLPHLKLCLVYCSLFSKSQLFDKDQLVRLWMAQGYINPVEGKRLDEIGCEYFYELLRRSFIHHSQVNKQAYVMHHQVYKLLQSFSENNIYMVEEDKICNISDKARHQSFVTQKDGAVVELKSSAESTSMHSFLLVTKSQSSSLRRFSCEQDLIQLSFPSDLLIKMKSVRALDLSYTSIKELPGSIGILIHLRFFDLNHTKVKTVPQSLRNLYNLQTLELQDCSHLLALPAGISYLSILQHLGISKPYSFVLLPRGVGKLTNLITLSNFYVGRGSSCYVIRELKSLVNLRGELCISGLSNVSTVDDAMEADLKNKEFIEKLILEWRGNDIGSESYIIRHILNDHNTGEAKNLLEQERNTTVHNEEVKTDVADEQWLTQIDISYEQAKKSREERFLLRRKVLELREGVLENLQPHSKLKELVMENYEGSKLARWMGDSSFSKLVSISLSNCYKCEVLPPLGQLPFLKYLLLKGFNKLKYVGTEFCGQEGNGTKLFNSLEKLEFEGMYDWEEWREVDGAFPHLLELSLNYCHKLRSTPQVFSSLEKLKLRYCAELISFPAVPLLKCLDVFHCNKKIVSALPEKMAKLGSIKIYSEKFADFTLC